MPTTTQITRMRQERRASEGRNLLGKTGLGCVMIISLLAALISILVVSAYAALTRDLPSVDIIPLLLEPPDGLYRQPTRLYDRSGEHLLLSLQNPAAVDSQYLWASSPGGENDEVQTLPGAVITGTLASADPYFWDHPGFSWRGFSQEGPTTLAQRLAHDLLLQDEPPGFRRAARERLLAAQITTRFGHEKVLEWYLNSADYGQLAYGVDAAARVYFGKPAAEIDLAEGAMLAAIADDPTLNPLDAPQVALERQKRVIQDMLRYRMISPAEGIQAARQELVFRQPGAKNQAPGIPKMLPNLAPGFTSLALEQLATEIKSSRLERGGLRVITTLDFDLQSQVECASSWQLERLQGAQPPSAHPKCQAARLLPSLPLELTGTSGGVEANTIVLDPSTGQILTLTGEPSPGMPFTPLPNRAPGSLVTPFIYLTAFTRGMAPATLVWDILPENQDTRVENFDGLYHGPVRLRIAMANDYLAPAESILAQVGPENVYHTARQLGAIPGDSLPPNVSSDLFVFDDINLVDVSRAFSIFANQGLLAGRGLDFDPSDNGAGGASPLLRPVTVLRVEDLSGEALLDWSTTQTQPIITPQLAYLMTDVLADETARWPSLGHPNALEIGRPAAAKLSRTMAGDSHWAIGYTPQLVVGVWLGTDEVPPPEESDTPRILQEAAASLWHAILQYANQDLPYQTWTIPAGISNLDVCDPSGLLPTRDCPNIVSEVFLPGSEPFQKDTLYRAFPINYETGRRATVFTPPDVVAKDVYFITPPEASSWAQGTVLDTPPEAFDIIPANIASQPDTAITYPQMFDHVRGEVQVSGRAGGADFAFYQIQVGQGLYPESWFLVGEKGETPVPQGQVGIWDTSGQNGLYALQILVARQDQSVERATVLVTVDNNAPQVQIISPVKGEEIDRDSIILRADIEDNMGVASAVFFLDDRLLASFTQPPYAISWSTKPGDHILRVIASDQAGNTAEASLEFTIR